MRSNEKEFVTAGDDGDFVAIFDLRADTKLEAGLGIATTFFVCIVLGGGALIFTNQTQELVISPIEKMIEKVNRISKNPLLAAQEEENEALAMEKFDEDMKKKAAANKN